MTPNQYLAAQLLNYLQTDYDPMGGDTALANAIADFMINAVIPNMTVNLLTGALTINVPSS